MIIKNSVKNDRTTNKNYHSTYLVNKVIQITVVKIQKIYVISNFSTLGFIVEKMIERQF